MLIGGRRRWERNFSLAELGDALACGSVTKGTMDKRRPQLDSAVQIGPETTLQDILIVVKNGGRGGRIKAAGIFHSQKLGAQGLVTPQAKELYANGYYGSIQDIK